jgi:hypothetical protein
MGTTRYRRKQLLALSSPANDRRVRVGQLPSFALREMLAAQQFYYRTQQELNNSRL